MKYVVHFETKKGKKRQKSDKLCFDWNYLHVKDQILDKRS